jgi:hypothetical protein
MDKHLNKRTMKKTEKHIHELVEETLKAFDGIERARPKPFLFTRLQAQIQIGKRSITKSGFLSPVLQQVTIAFVILVLVFNIYTAFRVLEIPASTNSVQAEEQAFIEELYPSTPTLYSINQTTTNP